MNKRDIKKAILAQLANELQLSVVIDGSMEDSEMSKVWEVQQEIANELIRRSKGATYSEDWAA